jgi:hypothetical protein
VPAETIAASQAGFDLPGKLTEPQAISGPDPLPLKRIALRVRRAVRSGRTVTVSGTAPSGTRLRVALRRGRRAVAAKRLIVRTANGTWRVKLRAPRRGRLTVRVTAGKRRLTARVRS